MLERASRLIVWRALLVDRFELLVGLASGIVVTLVVLFVVRWWQQRKRTFTEVISQREPLLKLTEVVVLFLALVTSAYSLYLFRECPASVETGVPHPGGV